MAQVRLGKIRLRWCHHCNVPVLETKICGRCGGRTDQVDITPPGDARPAFPYDIEQMRSIIDKQFGPGCGKDVVKDGHIVLLNKAPALDRMEEIIIDGKVIGSLRYDLDKGWTFLARMPAARDLQKVASKGRVVSDNGAVGPILNDSNLLAPGVISTDPDLQPGDEALIVNESGLAFAVGTARMSGLDMVAHKKGMAVKIRWREAPSDVLSETPTASMDMMIQANGPEMDRRISEAVSFIKRTIQRNDIPSMVSFSGGKDSLATLLLTLKADLKLPVFFIDTGLEFPETVEHVKDVTERHKLELIMEKAPSQAFDNGFKIFGPPGRDYRWCCKTNKLGPTVRAIMTHYPHGVLSFIGQRRYESENRASKPRVWNNPWTPGQIGASPIQDWTALHVWLLILGENEPYNPWYERGLDRIGCCICPASDVAELRLVVSKSEKCSDWRERLLQYARSNGLPDTWVEFGVWRWRRPPPSYRQELDRLHVDLRTKDITDNAGDQQNLRLYLNEGASPCTMGYSIEGSFSRKLHLERISNVLNIIGKTETSTEEGWVLVNDVRIFDTGALIAKGPDQIKIRKETENIRKAIIKAEECIGCGVCLGKCGNRAISIENEKIKIEESSCLHCGLCLEPCPAITFGNSIFDF